MRAQGLAAIRPNVLGRCQSGDRGVGWASVLSPERPLCRSCCTSGHGSNRIRPIGSVAFCREGRRYRSGDCCLRVRSRPRKRRPPQGGGARLLVDPRRAGHRPPFEDDPRRRGGAHCRARAGCGGNRGVVRRRRRPHRALRRAGTRRRARRGRQRGSHCREYAPASVKQAICGYGRADKEQMQRMVKMILSLPELPKPHHAADALAVAICHALAPPLLRAAAG